MKRTNIIQKSREEKRIGVVKMAKKKSAKKKTLLEKLKPKAKPKAKSRYKPKPKEKTKPKAKSKPKTEPIKEIRVPNTFGSTKYMAPEEYQTVSKKIQEKAKVLAEREGWEKHVYELTDAELIVRKK